MDDLEKDDLIKKLSELEAEHKELEEYLRQDLDQFTMQRLKRRKLMIKDQIKSISSAIYPNIIA
ncbi:MAG: hypothetical protein RLZZ59_839 [Pseudomonadota bacterium]|jgi:hypothetical protein